MADDNTQAARQRRKEKDTDLASNGHAIQAGDTSAASKPPTSALNPPDSSIAANILSIYLPTLSLIFAGCCSNVYTLESLISTDPSSGPLLTLTQFLLVSLFSSSSCLSVSKSPPFIHLQPRQIPIAKWALYTIIFAAINLLNNSAFGYKISVPLHIILRSAGPVTSMAVSYLFTTARYPPLKILAVGLLFVGVVLAALSDSYSRAPPTSNLSLAPANTAVFRQQAPGFILLFLALLLSAILGLYTDSLYTQHGRSKQATAESLFYSHILSLPIFTLQLSSLATSFTTLATTSPPLSSFLAVEAKPSLLHRLITPIPTALVMLFFNALTQCICISGVNRLAAQSSSLTVSIVLNIRKLVSLLLSIWIFGNKLAPGVVVGATLVFLGGGLYACPTGSARKAKKTIGVPGSTVEKKEL